jgi:hypothetical protein
VWNVFNVNRRLCCSNNSASKVQEPVVGAMVNSFRLLRGLIGMV